MSIWRGSLDIVSGPPARGGIQILGSVPDPRAVVAGFVALSASADPFKVTDREFV